MQIHEILYIDTNFVDLFGPSESTDPPVSGATSQADNISKATVASLYAGDDVETPPDIRPHLRDLKSGRWVLLDSGATASVFPRLPHARAVPDTVPALKAANGTPIPTYGKKLVKVQVGKHLTIDVNCYIADVKSPIIGWDWMSANGVEVRHHHVKGVGRKYYLPVNDKRVYLSMARPKEKVGIHAICTIALLERYDSVNFWQNELFDYNYSFFNSLHACEIRFPKSLFLA